MSYSSILAIYPEEGFEVVERLQNSWGTHTIIWDCLSKNYLDLDYKSFIQCLDDLWPLYKRIDIPEYQRSVLMMTFDRAYVSKENYSRAARDIRKFISDFPSCEGANHWPHIAEVFESNPEYPAIAIHGTSVVDYLFRGKLREIEVYDKCEEERDPFDWSTTYEVYEELPTE